MKARRSCPNSRGIPEPDLPKWAACRLYADCPMRKHQTARFARTRKAIAMHWPRAHPDWILIPEHIEAASSRRTQE
jgi:hypothetical protein